MEFESIICNAGYPLLTSGIDSSCGEDICQMAIITVNIEISPIQVFMKMFSEGPFQS